MGKNMFGRLIEGAIGGKRSVFIAIFGVVTLVLAGSAWAILAWINFIVSDVDQVEVVADLNALSPIYVDYYSDVEEYVSADSYVAMGNYAQDYPMPQNVQVLEGLTTHEVNGYMLNHFVAGLQVNCTYCHSLNNFAADYWGDPEAEANKWRARQHLRMSQDLNQQWLNMLPELTPDKQPYGAQITCATCHNGQAQFATYRNEAESFLPDDFRLRLEPDVVYAVDEQGHLNVNGRNDIGLDSTQYNQQVMYHMNASMNVGCTHCHNSRYFPSYEVPAKYYSMQMLQMTQYIQNTYGDILGGNDASCYMCHRQAVVPGGSAQSIDVMPDTIASQPILPLPDIFQMEPEDLPNQGYSTGVVPEGEAYETMPEDMDGETEMSMNAE